MCWWEAWSGRTASPQANTKTSDLMAMRLTGIESGSIRSLRPVTAETLHNNCVFDVMVTGNSGFAKTYLASQQIHVGAKTTTTVYGRRDPTEVEEPVTFTATVHAGNAVPTGMVQFSLDGAKAGLPLKLDPKGQAMWTTSSLKPGKK
jgi:hypothetical protein